MKAAVFTGTLTGLALRELPDPAPGPGEVLLRVRRTGICGSELHYTADASRPVPPDHVLGHEVCGEVVALGEGVTRYRLGERVVPMPMTGCRACAACLAGMPHRCSQARMDVVRGYAQYTRAGALESVALPPALDDDDGALVEPLAVGLQGVRKAALQPGDTVLVTGAGPIGLAAALFAQRLGAGRVAVLARSARRRGIALAMGATHFVAQADAPDAVAAVRDVLGGPPDAVIEAAGVPGAIAEAIDHVKTGGTVVSLGLCNEPDTFRPEIAVMKEVRLLFSLCYERRDFEHVVAVMAAGERAPRAMVTGRVTLPELPARFEQLRGPGPDCKVLIDPWG